MGDETKNIAKILAIVVLVFFVLYAVGASTYNLAQTEDDTKDFDTLETRSLKTDKLQVKELSGFSPISVTDDIHMQGHYVRDLKDPVEPQDAVTKQFLIDNLVGGGNGDFESTGIVPMSGNLDMGDNRLVKLADPTDPTDGLNFRFANAQFLKLTGGTLTGELNMGGKPITGLPVAVGSTSAVSFGMLDNYVKKGGDTMTGGINMAGQFLTGLPLGIASTDAVRVEMLDDYLELSGGTMTGQLNVPVPIGVAGAVRKDMLDDYIKEIGGTMTGQLNVVAPTTPAGAVRNDMLGNYINKVTGGTMTGQLNVPVPTTAAGAVRKDMLDDYLELDGGELDGALSMNTNKITGLGTPTNPNDAVNKQYVDDRAYGYYITTDFLVTNQQTEAPLPNFPQPKYVNISFQEKQALHFSRDGSVGGTGKFKYEGDFTKMFKISVTGWIAPDTNYNGTVKIGYFRSSPAVDPATGVRIPERETRNYYWRDQYAPILPGNDPYQERFQDQPMAVAFDYVVELTPGEEFDVEMNIQGGNEKMKTWLNVSMVQLN